MVYEVLGIVRGRENRGVVFDVVDVVVALAVCFGVFGYFVVVYEICLYAYDWLYAVFFAGVVEVYRTAHIAVVGHRNRGHTQFLGARHEAVYAGAAVEKTVVGVDV